MRLSTLQFTQFRSYSALDLDVSAKDLHVFIGVNGSGKTNILEAVSLLSLTRSFLGADEEDLRTWGTDFYRVRGAVSSDRGERETLEVVSQVLPRKRKAFFHNDVRISASEMVGRLPVAAFLPQDLQIFSDSPSERRRFLDQILSQSSPDYLRSLLDYQKTLKQRNALLKSIAEGTAGEGDLLPWDDRVAEEGSLLTIARLELIGTFNLTLSSDVRSLGEQCEDVSLHYVRAGTATTQESLKEELLSLLRHYRDRDIILQATSIGPHRDDWHIDVDGRNLLSFASRGQQRVSVLSLLFLQASYLEIRRNEKPLILLDDVFSELDDHHQERVSEAFKGHQVFITGTHLPGEYSSAQVWSVASGVIEPQ